MEDIRRFKKRGRRGHSWTSAQKALVKTVAPTRVVDATDCAGVGFGAMRAADFLPVQAAVGQPWQARTFAVAELAPSMTLKFIKGATNPRP